MKTRYYTVTRAARELNVTTRSVIAMSDSGCLPPVLYRVMPEANETTLVNAEAVDALAAMSKREESAA